MKKCNLWLLLALSCLCSTGFLLVNHSHDHILHYRIDANASGETNDCSILKVKTDDIDLNIPEAVKIDIDPKYLTQNPNICINIWVHPPGTRQVLDEKQEQLFVVKATDQCTITLNSDNQIKRSPSCTPDNTSS